VETLLDTAIGAYRVVTLASTYVIDLDLEVIRREPRTNHPDSTLLPSDEVITLLKLIECCVGRRMILLLDVVVFGITLTVRSTSQVVVTIDPEFSPKIETTP
jgi:hypothetical protein